MDFWTEWPVGLRVAGAAGVLILAGYATVHFAAPFAADSGQPEAPAVPAPPPGAADLLNRAVLIEGGTFLKGSDQPQPDVLPGSPYSTLDERPVLPMTVDGFWMQEHEVTNEEYRRFDPEHQFPAGQERHPVVNVTLEAAMAYAVSIGGTLPTEWQWEYAARGKESRKYPWGDAEPTCERAHYGECEPRGTIGVMSRPYGATPENIYDLAGNVWEWVVPIWFDPRRPIINKLTRRLRGGSYADDPFFIRAANRSNEFHSGFTYRTIGFRVVWPLER